MKKMMRYAVVGSALLCLGRTAMAQAPSVQAAINAVNIDSLIHDLRLLSGELPVDVGNGPELIDSRNKTRPGNAIAAAWLQQRILSMGYTPTVQVFSGGTGENVIAEKIGLVHPERKVVVCGHYDSMPGGPVASPAADDDGSGTVAVLEAMRVLAPYDFENTIVFALWDEEEYGLLGSGYYAGVAAANDVQLVATINLDAISYDGDADGLLRVHVRPIANSIAIKDSVLMVNTTYGLNLPIAVNNPGATYSDHASFWNEGYGAVLIIEDFDNDGNPYYHTVNDLVQYIDQLYFRGLARLGIGSVGVLAVPLDGQTGVRPTAQQEADVLFVYPNPVIGSARIRVHSSGGAALLGLVDPTGRQVLQMHEGALARGEHTFVFEPSDLQPGAYSVRMEQGGNVTAVRLLIVP
jgi:hypothetical protein